ncbi:lytic transglycosylase domain-containing protein [Lichenicoccus sp.]|uniref:lytic transglycosylase domain-containing protein n=1 Tax=Lichenicoccus sp. TaxID=2781899 RepID=UPI003D0EC5A9
MLRMLLLGVVLALSACAGGGRLAYGPGRTDYPQPGPRGDPWRPYIRAAARRFEVPPRWIRLVMMRESGGHEYRYGRAIRSAAGAMGLMQLMPETYADMRAQNGLGGDPYEPHDNIFAGTAYIRLLYGRYGAPGFLAAYNAGPQRLDDYVRSGRRLPNETIDYVAALGPELGARASAPVQVAYAAPPPRRRRRGFCVQDPDAAYDPSSECAPAPPEPQAQPQPQVMQVVARVPVGAWAVQVGAYGSPAQAHFADTMARAAAYGPLAESRSLVQPTSRFGGTVLYRARLIGLARNDAAAACGALAQHGMVCMIVAPGS